MTNNNQNFAIEISDLKKIYNFKKSNAFEALKGINLNIPKKVKPTIIIPKNNKTIKFTFDN